EPIFCCYFMLSLSLYYVFLGSPSSFLCTNKFDGAFFFLLRDNKTLTFSFLHNIRASQQIATHGT
ncbi:hypothetical protein ACJX0J_026950, partial [Zea mays]